MVSDFFAVGAQNLGLHQPYAALAATIERQRGESMTLRQAPSGRLHQLSCARPFVCIKSVAIFARHYRAVRTRRTAGVSGFPRFPTV
jgi:hypothetical protein